MTALPYLSAVGRAGVPVGNEPVGADVNGGLVEVAAEGKPLAGFAGAPYRPFCGDTVESVVDLLNEFESDFSPVVDEAVAVPDLSPAGLAGVA